MYSIKSIEIIMATQIIHIMINCDIRVNEFKINIRLNGHVMN